jgi:glycosyltransferase involved in cell wall biosynthesis
MDATVCIGTYGDEKWIETAQRAIASVEALDLPYQHVHDLTLARSRNIALGRCRTEFVIFLDADDELSPDYIEAMETGTADLRCPAVSWRDRGSRMCAPFVPQVYKHKHACTGDCLPEGNFIVIGALVKTRIAKDVGGFKEFEWSEDWDLWVRCWQAGATIETIPQAIYIAHFDPNSRNRQGTQAWRDKVHMEIHAANFP